MTSRKKLVTFSLLMLFCVAAAPLHAQILTYKDLHDFANTGGYNPWDYGQLAQGNDPYLYGTTHYGTFNNFGSVFQVATDGSTYTDLWSFDGTGSGMFPFGALTNLIFNASDGSSYFYGTANEGGNFGFGTLFRITPSGGIAILHHFNGSDGEYPLVPPVQGSDGNLYGVTSSGSTYRYTLPNGPFKQLPNNAPGDTTGPLVLAPDGYLYGTTRSGGSHGPGTVFRMTTPGGAIKIIYSFKGGTDGANPQGPIAFDNSQPWDGKLYGVTYDGGANNTGEVFQLTLSGTLTHLHDFAALHPDGTNNEGAKPIAGLLAASDGYLYGAASTGGASTYGTLFQASTKPSFSKLFDFTGAAGGVPGDYPTTTLMEDSDGCYYGLTTGGVSPNEITGYGNFFSLCPESIIQIVKVEGPILVLPGIPVQIIGNNLTQAAEVTFAGEQAQFQIDSNYSLTATVPSDAVDGFIAVILNTGFEIQTQSAEHILPLITNLDPPSGPVGTQVGIVGGGFAGTKKVTFGGVKATNFTVVNPPLIQAIVPTGAKTGKVAVTTPNGTAKSKQTFTVN